MKVAVCVSGLPKSKIREDLRPNIERLEENFPDADFYFNTWLDQKDYINKYFADKVVTFFPQPEMHYHPFIDADKNFHEVTPKLAKTIDQAKKNAVFRETSSHQTKQILAHANVADYIALEEYDILVRARWDTWTAKNAKKHFNNFIGIAAKMNCAVGFGTLKEHWSVFDRPFDMSSNEGYHHNFLFDQLIIHPRKIFDTYKVRKLYKEKLLLAAEFGWWQVLSKNNNHISISGLANPDRSVASEFLI